MPFWLYKSFTENSFLLSMQGESLNKNYSIEDIKQELSLKLDNDAIRGLTVLQDGRIAYMKTDTSIHILNPKDNFKETASTQGLETIPSKFNAGFTVGSLCTLSNGNIASFHETDEVDIYSINENTLTKIHTISSAIFCAQRKSVKVNLVPLPGNKFSFITDYDRKKISIWKGDAPYQNEPLKEIELNENISSYFPLKDKNVIVVVFDNNKRILVDIETGNTIETLESNKKAKGKGCFLYDADTLVIGNYFYNLKDKTWKDYTEVPDKQDCINNFDGGLKLRGNRILMVNNDYDYDSEDIQDPNYHFRLFEPFKKDYGKQKIEELPNYEFVTINEETFALWNKQTLYVYKY